MSYFGSWSLRVAMLTLTLAKLTDNKHELLHFIKCRNIYFPSVDLAVCFQLAFK